MPVNKAIYYINKVGKVYFIIKAIIYKSIGYNIG
jgi:hypothetical protein